MIQSNGVLNEDTPLELLQESMPPSTRGDFHGGDTNFHNSDLGDIPDLIEQMVLEILDNELRSVTLKFMDTYTRGAAR
jgi:hypothetical protein